MQNPCPINLPDHAAPATAARRFAFEPKGLSAVTRQAQCSAARQAAHACLARLGVVLPLLLGALPAAWANTGHMPARPTNLQTAPQASHHDASAVTTQAARWLAAQLQMPVDQVTVLAPDPRLRMPLCSTGLKFDTPFSNANTVRARCEAPQWQLFLRAQLPEPAAPTAADSSAMNRPMAAAVNASLTGSSSLPTTDAGRSAAPPRRAWALSRSVARGALLSPASVEATQVPAREADSLLITDAQALDQMEAVRDLPAGTPLRQTDIRPAVLVRQGQSVTMTVGQGTGFTITVRLEALQDGRFGDRVTLRNTESGRTVTGVVTGLNTVKGA